MTASAGWCMAITGATTCCSRPTAPGSPPCWTGSCRPSAIPMPISPPSSCNGRCPTPPKGAGWPGSTAPPSGCGRMRASSTPIAPGAAYRGSNGLSFTSPSVISAWPRSFRGSANVPLMATRPIPNAACNWAHMFRNSPVRGSRQPADDRQRPRPRPEPRHRFRFPRPVRAALAAGHPSGHRHVRLAQGLGARRGADGARTSEPSGPAAWRAACHASGHRDGVFGLLHRRSGPAANGSDPVAHGQLPGPGAGQPPDRRGPRHRWRPQDLFRRRHGAGRHRRADRHRHRGLWLSRRARRLKFAVSIPPAFAFKYRRIHKRSHHAPRVRQHPLQTRHLLPCGRGYRPARNPFRALFHLRPVRPSAQALHSRRTGHGQIHQRSPARYRRDRTHRNNADLQGVLTYKKPQGRDDPMTFKSLVAAACMGLMATAATAQDSSVKVGMITTLSGGGAGLGIDTRDGFMLAMKMAGDAAPDVVIEDDQRKPDIAVQLADKMIQSDKVDVLTGIVWSNLAMAVVPAATAQGKFYLSTNAAPSALAGKGCHPNYFSVSYQNDNLHEAAGAYVKTAGYTNPFILAPNYPAGQDSLTGFKRLYDGELAGEVYTQLGQTDYAAEIAQIRASGADSVFFFLPGGMGISFLKQYAESGLDIPVVGPAFSFDQGILQAVGDAALGVINTSQWNRTSTTPPTPPSS